MECDSGCTNLDDENEVVGVAERMVLGPLCIRRQSDLTTLKGLCSVENFGDVKLWELDMNTGWKKPI